MLLCIALTNKNNQKWWCLSVSSCFFFKKWTYFLISYCIRKILITYKILFNEVLNMNYFKIENSRYFWILQLFEDWNESILLLSSNCMWIEHLIANTVKWLQNIVGNVKKHACRMAAWSSSTYCNRSRLYRSSCLLLTISLEALWFLLTLCCASGIVGRSIKDFSHSPLRWNDYDLNLSNSSYGGHLTFSTSLMCNI